MIERIIRANLTPHAMTAGGMGGGYGSPALQFALCHVDELAWQQALWTFAQARSALSEANDLSYRNSRAPE